MLHGLMVRWHPVNKYTWSWSMHTCNVLLATASGEHRCRLSIVKKCSLYHLLDEIFCSKSPWASRSSIKHLLMVHRLWPVAITICYRYHHVDCLWLCMTFADSRCGCCSFLPNLLSKFGWNSASKFVDTIKDILRQKTGSPNITFSEVGDATLDMTHKFCFSW